jgi:hypothetical protein
MEANASRAVTTSSRAEASPNCSRRRRDDRRPSCAPVEFGTTDRNRQTNPGWHEDRPSLAASGELQNGLAVLRANGRPALLARANSAKEDKRSADNVLPRFGLNAKRAPGPSVT